jgi:hypothetical protein
LRHVRKQPLTPRTRGGSTPLGHNPGPGPGRRSGNTFRLASGVIADACVESPPSRPDPKVTRRGSPGIQSPRALACGMTSIWTTQSQWLASRGSHGLSSPRPAGPGNAIHGCRIFTGTDLAQPGRSPKLVHHVLHQAVAVQRRPRRGEKAVPRGHPPTRRNAGVTRAQAPVPDSEGRARDAHVPSPASLPNACIPGIFPAYCRGVVP